MTPHDAHFELRFAQSQQDLLAAQRLRYEVFVAELGGTGPLVDHENRFEKDSFDPDYDHLVLIDTRRDAQALDHVVGVYRLLPGDRAATLGRFYTEDEYDVSVLKSSNRRLLELGRSCVHPDYRGGTAMLHLWQGLADYIADHRIDILFGVASFHGTDAAALAQPLSFLHHNHLAPSGLRVRAQPAHFQTMDLIAKADVDRLAAARAIPSLIKGYLRLGGYIGEGAFVDHAFNTTDVCLIMDTAQINDRQRGIYTSRDRALS